MNKRPRFMLQSSEAGGAGEVSRAGLWAWWCGYEEVERGMSKGVNGVTWSGLQ